MSGLVRVMEERNSEACTLLHKVREIQENKCSVSQSEEFLLSGLWKWIWDFGRTNWSLFKKLSQTNRRIHIH